MDLIPATAVPVPAPPASATPATELAAGMLGALGCECTTGPDGRLGVRYLGHAVACAVDWAGPVDVPLAGEADVQAACGIMAVHGRRVGGPAPLCVPYTATAAGVLAVQGVLAALIDRHRGGRTRRVTTSVAQAALLAVGQYLAATTAADDQDDGRDDDGRDDDDRDDDRFAAGGPPFVGADGVAFEIETFDAGSWQRFWAALGAAEVAVRHGWRPFLFRYATASCPLPDELFRAARRHGFGAVAAAGAGTGVSVVAVREAPTGIAEPPWRVTPLAGPVAGARPAGPGRRPGPDRLPLHGFVVVEATRRLQGPLAGHLLRLLGAEVFRIEPPGGDPLRGMPPMAGDTSARYRALNDGKHLLEIDIRSAAGQRAVRGLVAGADVFLHNWAPGRAAAYRLDTGDLAAVRAGLVYAHASGWGGALGADPPKGTDYLVQAHSGLAARVWPDHRLAPSLFTLTDVLGGLVCAAGVLAGLLAVLRTGRPQRVDSSLLSAAGLLLRQPRQPPVPPRVAVRADLAELAADPRFAAALDHRRCCLVRPPWEFSS
jgi:crotonobetainyl-CoA:carnitine CoA-transferase CaiB-like acyl-CoA transferase